MNDPWFDPNLYAWIPGTVYGTTVGIFGGVSGSLAQAGKARTLCLAGWWLFFGMAATFLVISIVAWFTGQPYGIWYAFGLPAVLGLFLCPMLMSQVIGRCRQSEERRMHAADLDRT